MNVWPLVVGTFDSTQENGNEALMPALDDIRALRAQRERALPQSRPAADDDDDDEPDDPNVIESGALSHEDEMLAMRGTAPFGSSTPEPARYQEQAAPEASGMSDRMWPRLFLERLSSTLLA